MIAVGSLLLLAGAGCAKRLNLSSKELEKVKTEAGVQPLRVYTSKKLINLRAEGETATGFVVQREIVESSDRRLQKELITKNIAGQIIKIDDLNGSSAVWVTFDPQYTKPEDAMVFVQGDDGLFRLSVVPARKGFGDATSYRGCKCKRRKLKSGRMKSLAEANDVLLVKKKNGKILTVDLQVKKVTDDRTTTRTRRAQGID